jgi:iron(III) transport system ATP-binding protein
MARVVLRRLTKAYGKLPVIKDFSLEIADQEFITLLGPSGCGKTTILRLIAGFLRPDAGDIIVDGQVLSSPTAVVPPERRRMGMVFQNYALWPHMTVFENVAFGLRLRKLSRAEVRTRVEHALDLVGLSGFEARYPAHLSGGQQQRVALARALVIEPSILLLDEPLSNLDAKLRERMRGELKEIQRRTGITFIYVTHDQTEAMAISDRIAVIRDGVLQQCASPREIYDRPANIFVADFMGSVNLLETSLLRLEEGCALVRTTFACDLLVPLSDLAAQREPVIVAVRPEDVEIHAERPGGLTNTLRGRIAEVTFLGSIIDYRVEVNGFPIRVRTHKSCFRGPGELVFLHIPPQACRLFGRED